MRDEFRRAFARLATPVFSPQQAANGVKPPQGVTKSPRWIPEGISQEQVPQRRRPAREGTLPQSRTVAGPSGVSEQRRAAELSPIESHLRPRVVQGVHTVVCASSRCYGANLHTRSEECAATRPKSLSVVNIVSP